MSLVAPGDYREDSARRRQGRRLRPFLLESYEGRKTAELKKNPDYNGFAKRKNDAVTIRCFEKSADMVSALKADEIDATYRGLTAEEVELSLEDNKDDNAGLQIVERHGRGHPLPWYSNPKDPAAANAPCARPSPMSWTATRWSPRSTGAPPSPSLHDPQGRRRTHHELLDAFGDPDADKAKSILSGAGITSP
ncbi:solute-binding transport lipoprotein [Streptomyces badius]